MSPDGKLKPFFRHRPALAAAVALVLGSILSRFIGINPALQLRVFSLVFVLALLTTSLLLLLRKSRVTALALSFLSALAFGGILSASALSTFENSELRKASFVPHERAVIEGIVTDDWTESKNAFSFPVAVDRLQLDSTRTETHGLLHVTLAKEGIIKSMPLPQKCSKLRLFTALEPLKEASNPHEFSWTLKLKSGGYAAQCFLKSSFDYVLIEPAHGNDQWGRIQKTISSIRTECLSILSRSLKDPEVFGFVSAVVLGERSEISDDRLEQFTKTGISHILAVSGFNVAIVALMVMQLLRMLGISRRTLRICLSMVAIFAYCLLVGFQPSVVRALIMVELAYLALLIERRPDPLNIVASAALVTLVFRYQDLYDVGFQLSYSAVLGMAIVYPELKRLLMSQSETPLSKNQKRLHQLAEGLLLSIAATFSTLPVTASHFYRFSFIGLLVNIIAVPLSAVITVLGFLLIPITLVSSWLGDLYGEALTFFTRLLFGISDVASRVPFASLPVIRPSTVVIVIFTALFYYCLRSLTKQQFAMRGALACVILGLVALLPIPIRATVLPEDKFTMTFFDVGQGDCILLHTPSGRSCFIDFGGIRSDQTSVFKRRILPALSAEGLMPVQLGFISHMHIDHYGGSVDAIQDAGLTDVYTSGERARSSIATGLDSSVNALHIPVRSLAAGDILHLDSNLTVYVLNPTRRTTSADAIPASYNMNSGSLVLKVVYGSTSALLLGDIEGTDEDDLVDHYGDFLKTDLVKVAHHGSGTSSSERFIREARPHYAVISVGARNSFHHPSLSVLRKWIRGGAEVLRTDRDGAVIFASDGKNFEQVSWR